MQSQETFNQTAGSPMPGVSAGSWIALRYQENGHVTILPPDTRAVPGKLTRGVVSIYGTTQPAPDDKLQAIHNVWTKDGKGEDGRGRLLARSSFDDRACYQVNNTTESQRRQSLPQRQHDDFEGQNLWCGTRVKIPDGAVAGSVQTLYWVWNWPTAPGPVGAPLGGKSEIYTMCIDVKVVETIKIVEIEA
ncbi:hypothetical protein LTR50_004637 [Elasticomyces elasticus]|nr:hypothetical protein LTR50_004637 [Elasticomyces elasticus]